MTIRVMRSVLFVALPLLGLGCNPVLTGAPCTNDANCPHGQYCGVDGKCANGRGWNDGGAGGERVDGGDGFTDSGMGDGGAEPCSTTSCTGCCDATGACRSGETPDACGANGMSCGSCGAGLVCRLRECQPLTANGGLCQTDAECAHDHCVDHVCCNATCTEPCESCAIAGKVGRCSPIEETSEVAAACAPYVCDGINGTCPTTCTTQRQCAAGRFCDGAGACVVLKSLGDACTSSSQCTSTFCADGTCCDKPCSGSCDRCNLPGSLGACSPAPATDPGSPACGSNVTCDGTLPDCPILCASGCPAHTYCSTSYCSAQKQNGVQCSAPDECLNGKCVDAVCCNTACDGDCDACSAAAGASSDGVCTLLGNARICRAATSLCDVEERCAGTSATCPNDSFADAGVGCGTPAYSAWGPCTPSAVCSTSGKQTRTHTSQACTGTGACVSEDATETQSCVPATNGRSCGDTTFGQYTSCSYPLACSTSGTRTRTRVDPVCTNGTCTSVQTTETDSTGCARATTGTSCGTTQMGPWGECGYTDACATSGTHSRPVTTYTCSATGSCDPSTTNEVDTSLCTRNTQGTTCASTVYGNYTTCSRASACSNSGSRTRAVTTYACNATRACTPSTTTETDVAGCARNSDGTVCVARTCGTYSGCGVDCIQEQNCSETRCLNQTCTNVVTTTEICAKPQGCCLSCIPR